MFLICVFSINSLIEKNELTFVYTKQQSDIILPIFAADFSELPENDIIQNLRRSCANRQDAFLKVVNFHPSQLLPALLQTKKISCYFLLVFHKIDEEKNFLHLFDLY